MVQEKYIRKYDVLLKPPPQTVEVSTKKQVRRLKIYIHALPRARVEYKNRHKSQHFAKNKNEVEIFSLVCLNNTLGRVQPTLSIFIYTVRLPSFHTPKTPKFQNFPVPPQTQHRAAKTDIKSPCILWIHIGHGPEQ